MQPTPEPAVAFSWARPTPLEVTRRIDAGRRVYVISDLHLGDGTRSDIFLGKDRELVRFLERMREEDAHLVIAGKYRGCQRFRGLGREWWAHDPEQQHSWPDQRRLQPG